MTEKDLPVNQESAVLPSGISHGFDTGYAIAYGVDEAIMIKNLQFFITANANRGNNFHEGRFWTYDKLEDFPKHFPYWSVDQVRRVIRSLISQEVIIKGDFNKSWSNRTCWYAFKDESQFIRHTKPPKPAPKDIPADLPKPTNEDIKEKSPDLVISPNEKWENHQMTNGETPKCIYDTSSIPDALSSSSSLKVPEPEQMANAIAAKAAEEILKESSKDKPKRTRTPSEFSPKVKEIGDKMINALVRNKPNYVPPRNLAPFLTHVDYLLRLDKRDPVLLIDVFSWAIADSFWCDKMYKPNPAEYLRKQFDQLEMKMNAKPAPKERKFAPSSNDARGLEKMLEWEKGAL